MSAVTVRPPGPGRELQITAPAETPRADIDAALTVHICASVAEGSCPFCGSRLEPDDVKRPEWATAAGWCAGRCQRWWAAGVDQWAWHRSFPEYPDEAPPW